MSFALLPIGKRTLVATSTTCSRQPRKVPFQQSPLNASQRRHWLYQYDFNQHPDSGG
jgi:hypothetical protein